MLQAKSQQKYYLNVSALISIDSGVSKMKWSLGVSKPEGEDVL